MLYCRAGWVWMSGVQKVENTCSGAEFSLQTPCPTKPFCGLWPSSSRKAAFARRGTALRAQPPATWSSRALECIKGFDKLEPIEAWTTVLGIRTALANMIE